MNRTNELSKPMLRVQARLGRPLKDYLRERYVNATAAEIGSELGVSESTITNWMDRLDLERRFPGQRPEAVA